MDADLVDDLVRSAHGDLARVREILSQHPELVDARARWGETPLQAAAQVGDRAIAEYLLNMGAPLDICTAVMLGMSDTVAVYLADDPKLAHATGAHGLPVLYFAVLHEEMAVAEILVRRGADVNQGEGVTTALHAAALFNKPAMARWLLKKKARLDVKDRNGKTPFQIAKEKGHVEVVAALEEAAEARRFRLNT